jgi:transcriptional regulator with XRE-family HTH domain
MGDQAVAVGSSGGRDSDARQRFGRLLAEALKGQGLKQDDLAARLGATQPSVSGWINGRYEPAADTVFAVERTLGLEPGHLSRPLGYLPVEAVGRPASVEAAIAQSTLLGDDEKAALIGVYHVLVTRDSRPAGGERASTTPGSGGRGRRRPVAAAPERPRSVPGNH